VRLDEQKTHVQEGFDGAGKDFVNQACDTSVTDGKTVWKSLNFEKPTNRVVGDCAISHFVFVGENESGGKTNVQILTETDEATQRLRDGQGALEANAREYVPAANAAWVEKFPGVFTIRDGTMATGEITGPGLGAVAPGE